MLSLRHHGSKLVNMRRAFVLASVAAAAVMAAALLYYRDDSSPRSATPLPGQTGAPELEGVPSTSAELTSSDLAPTEGGAAQNQPPPSSSVNDEIRRQRRPKLDEAEIRALIREQATNDVRLGYSLLLEDLPLSVEEKADLVALLIEMQVERAWSGEIRGRTIPDQERYERIAAVIGNQKLLEFLELEQNLPSYWETTQIARLMRAKQLPLTEEQRGSVFDVVVEVRARYPYRQPASDLDRNSDEWIDHDLAQADEFDRHIVELVPSVLSPTQVAHLSNAYDFMSRDRHSMIEMQRKRRAAGDPLFSKMGWSTPGRWPAEVMRD